ncbi:DUF3885 domain-containing protein [Acinetobacter indicus]|uniref:DUF3885 domain-containing protein n=1 Tax=Acinetobacter indicus TaxID=756892 RepID=UPI001A8EE4C6|nr:hypothetical protein [Acinetobacter indicus]QSQ95822.1 hypothetical protein J0W33_13110 [Acinetobacter indicus]
MTDTLANNFDYKWNMLFPNKLPIPYLFKHYFTKNWIRLHSLPNSKRYADCAFEIDLLINRQNQIISDCFPQGTTLFIVSGNTFIGDSSIANYDQVSKLSYNFISGSRINLHEVDPEHFDDDENNDLYFTPMFTEVVWEQNSHDDLLLKIANDETRAFLISFEKKIIVAPYDGGLDIIIDDFTLKSQMKQKYHEMLSARDDQL